MDYVSYTGFPSSAWLLIGIALIACGAIPLIVGFMLSGDRDEPRTAGAVISVLVLLGLGAGLIAGGVVVLANRTVAQNEWRADIAKSMKDTYGVEFADRELDALRYPAEEPGEDFKVFGSAIRDMKTEAGFDRVEVFLVWDEGRMELASSADGETFTTLEAR